jgi:hypothetical protein
MTLFNRAIDLVRRKELRSVPFLRKNRNPNFDTLKSHALHNR